MKLRTISELNMIPFIDIMLVLLTIVLTTSSFIATGRIQVDLPQASSSNEQPDARIKTIEIRRDGQIYLMGDRLELEQLKEKLSSFAKDTPFLLQADKDIKLQYFVDVADVLKNMSFYKVSLQTISGMQ